MALASCDITETFLEPLLGLASPETERALLGFAAAAGEDCDTGAAPVWRLPEKPQSDRKDPTGSKKRKVSSTPDGF